MLVPLQPQGTCLEGEGSTLNLPLTRHSHKALELAKVHSLEEGLVEAITVLIKGLDQLRE
jgi:hypothetical protein